MFPVTLSYSFNDCNSIGRGEYINLVFAWINEKMDFILNSELDLIPLEPEAIDLTYTHVSVTFGFKNEQDALLFTIRYK